MLPEIMQPRSVTVVLYIFTEAFRNIYPSSFSPFSLRASSSSALQTPLLQPTKLDTTITMGKKIGTLKTKRGSGKDKATDEDVSLKKVDCDWSKSSVRTQDLEDLREKGLLLPL